MCGGPPSGPWKAPTLRKVLLSARIAGLREHGVDPSGMTLGQLTTAVWLGAVDRQTWDQVRAVLLNPGRATNLRAPTKYLLAGLIECGSCGARMFSRPKADHTRRYLCASSRPGHQLAIVAQPLDDLVAEETIDLLTAPSFREAMSAQAGAADDGSLGRALADLAAAQGRLQALDDDFYVHGGLAEGRYRSIRVKLEREIDRLHALADAATKERIVLHPDPRALWAEADFPQRRELVRLVVQRVVVMPAQAGVGRFDSSRVRIDLTPWGPGTSAVQGTVDSAPALYRPAP